MGKLIELLNEFERVVVMKSYMYPVYYYDEDKNKILNLYIGFNTEDEVKYQWLLSYIVSKSYWFIQRLVENDKIDFENMEWHWRLIWYLTDNMEKPTRDKVKEGVVIMLLSISDTPIEDLISYLK